MVCEQTVQQKYWKLVFSGVWDRQKMERAKKRFIDGKHGINRLQSLFAEVAQLVEQRFRKTQNMSTVNRLKVYARMSAGSQK